MMATAPPQVNRQAARRVLPGRSRARPRPPGRRCAPTSCCRLRAEQR